MSANTQILTQSIYGFKSERNSSDTALNSGATFTGLPETFASNEIFVAVKADQDGTLYIDFSDDDGTTYETKEYEVFADVYLEVSELKAARTARVRFTNDSASNQTSFSINTYYGQYGIGKTSNVPGGVITTNELVGFTGFESCVGIFNELLVAEPKDQISVLFDYGVLQNRPHGTVVSTTGDGTVADDNTGIAVISSTTGTAKMTTRDRLTYDAGHTNIARFTCSFSGAGTGYAGLYDDDNGFFIRYNDGALAVGRRKETVDTIATSANFNGDDISRIDWTKIQICYIIFGFLGVGNPSFFVLNEDGKPLLIHQFKTIGSLTSTHIRHPSLPIRLESDGAMSVKSGSLHASIFGRGDFTAKQNFGGDHSVSVTGTSTSVLANYRAVTDFEYKAGVTSGNKKKAVLLAAQFFIDAPATGTGTVKFTIGQASSISGASWSDVSQYNSVMEVDTNGTPSGANPTLTRYVGYAGTFFSSDVGGVENLDSDRLGLAAYAGDIFTIRAENLGSTTVTCRVTLNWEEV